MLLVASIVALPLLCALVALGTGVRALRVIRHSGGRVKGRGLAVTGILFGSGGVLFGALVGTGVAYKWLQSPASLQSKSDAELEALLTGSSAMRQQAAAQALAQRGTAARDLLLQAFRDTTRPSPERLAALQGLQSRADVNWKSLLPDLMRVMGGTDFELQSAISGQLQWAPYVRNADLMRLLLDPDPAVRTGATAVMQSRVQSAMQWGGMPRLGAADLRKLITILEQSGDREVKLAVIGWIEGMGAGGKPALPALKLVAADPTDGDLSTAAQSAIAVISQ